jgi:hypothetical protein
MAVPVQPLLLVPLELRSIDMAWSQTRNFPQRRVGKDRTKSILGNDLAY